MECGRLVFEPSRKVAGSLVQNKSTGETRKGREFFTGQEHKFLEADREITDVPDNDMVIFRMKGLNLLCIEEERLLIFPLDITVRNVDHRRRVRKTVFLFRGPF